MANGKGSGIGVVVRNGRLDIALSVLKKKIKNAKVLIDYKARMEFQKPSDKKRRERALRKKRSQKYSHSQK
jgi:ribosomal protein S21